MLTMCPPSRVEPVQKPLLAKTSYGCERLAAWCSCRLLMVLALGIVLSGSAAVYGAEVTTEQSASGVRVLVDGQLFTEYLTKSGAKPALWPVIGPTGKAMTRSYPIRPEGLPSERKDHPHHRSLWFTHGDVAGVDFWGEKGQHGTIRHREFRQITSGGPIAKITTVNDWLDSDGHKICQDERRLGFGTDDDVRWIDFDITFTASEGEVTFGDTKEGSFGVRVAGSMKVDAGKGRIVNSSGLTNKQAWGKPAEWVDYHGPVDGELVGIAILNHPSSFRYPTYWHVRTYGLFAANPFGLHHFLDRKEPIGAYTLPAGQSITLRYRVLLHTGNEKDARIVDRFKEYAAVGE
ncbi:MAG: PmoA family protein [Pirellulales bacterium]